jgi:uroporphyrinogen decarboxylase
MNSRERLLTSLNHKEPDRLPIDFGGTLSSSIHYQAYEELRQHLGMAPSGVTPRDLGAGICWGTLIPHQDMYKRMHSDVQAIGLGRPDSWNLDIDHGTAYDTYVDEWGTTLYRPKDGHYFDCREYPIQQGTLEAFLAQETWPDPLDPGRWRGLRRRCMEVHATGRAVTAFSILGCGLFEQPPRIMPMEEFYMGIASDRRFATAVLGKLFDLYHEATIRMLEEAGDVIDVWVYWDDLGGQNNLLVSPEWYQKHLMPLHRQLFDTVRSMTQAKIFFHSCGAVRPLIPYLIDVGVDILNPVQVSARGMEDTAALKRDFGKEIVFWGAAVDPQGTLAFGTPQEVSDEVRRHIDDLAPGGGFVFANVHNIQYGVPPANIVAMFDTAFEYGAYT